MAHESYAGISLLAASHPHLTRHVCLFSVLVSMVVALAGVAAVYFALQLDKSSDTMSMLLLTVGTTLLLVALYRLFWRSKELVYTPTGSVVKEGSCYLDMGDLPVMSEALAQSKFGADLHVPVRGNGNARMDYIISKDHRFVAVQLQRFIPYTYEPAS